MIKVRKGDARGASNHGWLDSKHSFSFADYHDPAHMGFRALRVINEDRVTGGKGFGTHGHRDMEILSYVLEGALRHKDSIGTGSVIKPGEVQRMTAGSGVMHSEQNDSATEPVHFLQIWILPEARNLKPGYEQRAFPESERRGAFRLVAARDGRDGAVTVHQDVSLWSTLLDAGATATLPLAEGRHAWVQVARGAVKLGGASLKAGDGAAVSDERALTFTAEEASEVLVFDLA